MSAFISITFSHMWTRILRDNAHCLAWIGIYVLVMLPLISLAYMWLRYGELQRLYVIFAIAVAVLFGCLACRSEPQLDRATGLLHAACTCAAWGKEHVKKIDTFILHKKKEKHTPN